MSPRVTDGVMESIRSALCAPGPGMAPLPRGEGPLPAAELPK